MVAIMIAVCVFVLALAFAPTLKYATDDGLSQASCSSATNKFVKGFCVIFDMLNPSFTAFLIAIALILLGAKIFL